MMSKTLLILALLTPGLAFGEEGPGCHPSPATQEILDRVRKAGNKLDQLSPEVVQTIWLSREADARNRSKTIEMASVRDVSIPARNHQIPARIFTPRTKQKKLPILIFYHGGGWTLGSVAGYDSITRELARVIPAIVVSVDYRLAPEYPFPAATTDAYLAMEWVARNANDLGGDLSKLMVGGDSGGGSLAAVVARKAHEEGLKLALQVLFYPSVDNYSTSYPSFAKFGKDYVLTTKSVEDFRAFYLPNKADWSNPDASPLLAGNEKLKGVAPAYIMLIGCDPLQDEGLAYAEKLRKLGVKVTVKWIPDMVHGFLGNFNHSINVKAASETAPILDEAAKTIATMLKGD